eukprot:TRINITY_DN4611_c0_g1_i4.p1 TRINITY_DN4611_c0_g1~~TRINITY_DN4611_c0_g1_i4.p1  ORF type:complete len:245 (-),score=59.18 TRINITY_DN4611_c0_g1_i4:12-746(-)
MSASASWPQVAAGKLDSTAGLSERWTAWVKLLRNILTDGLLPIMMLHMKRGHAPRVPLSSFAAALSTIGGVEDARMSAAGVGRLLADICPDTIGLQAANGEEPPTISLKLTAAASCLRRNTPSESSRPASCQGVVAKGYSMALDKGFYVNLAPVEKELATRTRRMVAQIEAFAQAKCGEDKPPPSLVEAPEEAQPAAGQPVSSSALPQAEEATATAASSTAAGPAADAARPCALGRRQLPARTC